MRMPHQQLAIHIRQRSELQTNLHATNAEQYVKHCRVLKKLVVFPLYVRSLSISSELIPNRFSLSNCSSCIQSMPSENVHPT